MTLEQAISAYIPQMPGWSTPEKCQILADCILSTKCKLSVEIGVFAGRGLIAMGMAHRELHHRGVEGTYATGVDPLLAAPCLEGDGHSNLDVEFWNDQDKLDQMHAYCLNAIEGPNSHHIAEWCRFLRMRSDEAVKLFADSSIGVLHQDSNHSEKISCDEVARWAPKMLLGSFWAIDDSDDQRQVKAMQMLLDYGFVEVKDAGKWKLYRLDSRKVVNPEPPVEPQVAEMQVLTTDSTLTLPAEPTPDSVPSVPDPTPEPSNPVEPPAEPVAPAQEQTLQPEAVSEGT